MNRHPDDRRTTELLHDAIQAQPGDDISLNTLLVPLRARAFGVMLLVLAIPNFIPAPIGIGGVMGVLVIGLGLQMLCGLEQPLMPGWVRRKTLHRRRVEHFLQRTRRPMSRLERLCKPRLERLTVRPWSVLSGLVLMLLGLMLAMPIPFTNYVFGVILLAYAFALMERDGALLVGLWVLTLAMLTLSATFSNALFEMMQNIF